MDKLLRTISFTQAINPATALMTDTTLMTVEAGAAYEVVEVIESHTVAGTDGSAVTVDVKRCASAVAPASGDTVLGSTFNLKSTANTPVSKTKASGLASTQASRTIVAGQRLCLDFSGALTALAGFNIVVVLKQLRAGTNRN